MPEGDGQSLRLTYTQLAEARGFREHLLNVLCAPENGRVFWAMTGWRSSLFPPVKPPQDQGEDPSPDPEAGKQEGVAAPGLRPMIHPRIMPRSLTLISGG